MTTKPTTEERTWAVISHLSTLAFGMGLLLPILGWSEQRQKSKYASFQCLQALGYQSLGYTIWLLTYIAIMILFFLIFAFMAARSGNPDSFIPAWGIFFFLVIFGLLGFYLLLPVIAAVACAFGKEYRYPIMGKGLAVYLDYRVSNKTDEAASLNEVHEEHWVASMGHFSIIIAIWGIIAPVITWILQGKHSAFLKFQSIQTTIYQVIVNLLLLGAIVVDVSGIILFISVLGITGNSNTNTPGGMLGLLLFFLASIIAALIVLLLPLFHILGQWAGYRVLKGDNYHYPILGKLVEKQLAKSYGVQELAPVSNGEPFDSTKETS